MLTCDRCGAKIDRNKEGRWVLPKPSGKVERVCVTCKKAPKLPPAMEQAIARAVKEGDRG
jgi:hypothetical protein